MFPHRTPKQVDAYQVLKRHFSASDNGRQEDGVRGSEVIPYTVQEYLVLHFSTVSIEPTEEADDLHRALAEFWKTKPNDFLQCYNMVGGYGDMPDELKATWGEAFSLTRKGREEEHPPEPSDPEAVSAGGKST